MSIIVVLFKIALGDVNVELEANTNDEIGMLSQSFKTMAENIKGSAIAAQKVAAGELVEGRLESRGRCHWYDSGTTHRPEMLQSLQNFRLPNR